MKEKRKRAGFRRFTVLLCFLCFVLTACGEGEAVEETTSQSEGAASVDNGTLEEDSVALSVGKTTVPYKEYKVYYYFMQNQYEGLLTDDVWSYTGASENGKSIGQEAIEDVLRLIIQVKVIAKAASVQGVTLAADEKEEADYNAKQFYDGLSDDVKQANSISLQLLVQIFEENKLAEKMYRVISGQVDVNVTEEQSRAARVQLIYLNTEGQDKEAVKQKADSLYQQAVANEGNFYKLAKENSQSNEVESIIGQMDTRTTLVNTVLGMKKYEMSGVIEEQNGYYIAYCVTPSGKKVNETYKNQLVEERQVSEFQKAYKQWSEQYEVKVSKSLLVE